MSPLSEVAAVTCSCEGCGTNSYGAISQKEDWETETSVQM